MLQAPDDEVTYSFRFRFRMGLTVRIDAEAPELVLSECPPGVVRIKARDTESVASARKLAVVGSGYATAEEARSYGERWLRAVQAGFARAHIGADFGVREPEGGMTPDGLRWAEQQFNIERALDDQPGVLVYVSDPMPHFVAADAAGVVGKPEERVTAAILDAWQADAAMTEQLTLAYDLFAASFFQQSADARFLMLMMAVETAIESKPRADAVVAHVDHLIAQTRASALPDAEVASLLGSLRWLRQESISRGGQRLAAQLGGRRYMDEDAPTFFKRCYEMRSKLVHGSVPRPSRSEVDRRAADLESFVGDLIAVLAGATAVPPSGSANS